MTDLDPKNDPVLDPAAEPEAIDPPKPPPEPMTPKRVLEWNAYYDLYVAMFVLLMAFLGSANKIQTANSAIWSSLQAGQQTATTGRPAVTDETSIAGQGRRWVNIPWLFELMHYGIYSTAYNLIMPPPITPAPGASPESIAASAREAAAAKANAAPRAEQTAAGAMIAVDALVRALTAFLLLGLRRKGPGLWWTAICVTLALGLTISPEPVQLTSIDPQGVETRQIRATLGLQVGGIAGTNSMATVAPETWGLMFLAVELLLLHHAVNLGKSRRLFAIVPLFLLWANMDESYAYGLILLAAAVIGLIRQRMFEPARVPIKPGVVPAVTVEQAGPSLKTGLIVLALSFGVTFLSPSHVFGVLASFETIQLALQAAWSGLLRAFGANAADPTMITYSIFSEKFVKSAIGETFAHAYQNYYFALVGIGLMSFLLNRRNFSIGRFLMFVAASALWALAQSYSTGFAVVFVVVMALNGQEWYLATIGTEGRLGMGWNAWSTGGRIVTILVIFYAIFQGTTGWGAKPGDSLFGFGFNPDDFPFEAAEALKSLPIEGNILNTGAAQGDAIAWRTLPKHKAFFIDRAHLNAPNIAQEVADLRQSLKGDEVDKWKPVLDANGISVVLIQVSGDPTANAPRTYAKLLTSPNWIPFYFDGSVAMFGRNDAKGADLAYFQANRLDSAELAYKRPKVVPAWQRPPTQTSDWIDSVFENRLLDRAQPHTEVAKFWLFGPTMATTPTFPDPARCLLAVREARIALSIKPDDPLAYRLLVDAYRRLLAEESAMIAGVSILPANANLILQVPQQSRLLANRTRQLITAMSFALQTSPPPKTADNRKERANLNFLLSQLYAQIGAFDLAREHLLAIDGRPGELPDSFFAEQAKQLGELSKRIDQVQAQLNDLVIQNKISAFDKARFARDSGMPGLAIHELEEANETAPTTPGLKPLLVDLYCDFGQPEKAYDMVGRLEVGDASLATSATSAGVGTAAFRQGKLNLLLGNYDYAVNLWIDKSLGPIRRERSAEGPKAAEAMLFGEPKVASWRYLEMTENVNTQAQWEFEIAMAALEGGLPPDVATSHFEMALKLAPTIPVRPVIAYYLLKMGKDVPPMPVEEPSPPPAEVPTAPPSITPGELPKDVFAPSKP